MSTSKSSWRANPTDALAPRVYPFNRKRGLSGLAGATPLGLQKKLTFLNMHLVLCSMLALLKSEIHLNIIIEFPQYRDHTIKRKT